MAKRSLGAKNHPPNKTGARRGDIVTTPAAQASTPLLPDVGPPVEVEIGGASGIRLRTYYSCNVRSTKDLLEGWKRGLVPAEALMANQAFLNSEATRLKGMFEQVYCGCELKVKQTYAG